MLWAARSNGPPPVQTEENKMACVRWLHAAASKQGSLEAHARRAARRPAQSAPGGPGSPGYMPRQAEVQADRAHGHLRKGRRHRVGVS